MAQGGILQKSDKVNHKIKASTFTFTLKGTCFFPPSNTWNAGKLMLLITLRSSLVKKLYFTDVTNSLGEPLVMTLMTGSHVV